MTEDWEERQKARRVLEAAVAEAGGKPGEPAFALPTMRRAGVTNAEFRRAARYLDEQGWIAEGREDYETFVVTSEGVDRVTRGRDEVPDTEEPESGQDTEEPESGQSSDDS